MDDVESAELGGTVRARSGPVLRAPQSRTEVTLVGPEVIR